MYNLHIFNEIFQKWVEHYDNLSKKIKNLTKHELNIIFFMFLVFKNSYLIHVLLKKILLFKRDCHNILHISRKFY